MSLSTISLSDPFDIDTLESIDYDGDIDKAINDVKRILVITRSGTTITIIYKSIGNSVTRAHYIQPCLKSDLHALFSDVTIKGVPDVDTLWKFINHPTYKRQFYKKGYGFYIDNPEYFSVFAGYRIAPTTNFQMNVIQPILKHWEKIICSGESKKYEFLLNWIAYIIQKPDGRTGKAIICIGAPGAGKTTFFSNVICDLIGEDYSIRNCTDAANIFGTYNSLIEYKKLAILNEARESGSQFNKFDYDRFKSIITDDVIDINPKYGKQRISQNVFNLIINTNNSNPFRVAHNDRRVYVVKTINKFANNNHDTQEQRQIKINYFINLAKCMEQQDFLPNLMYFFKNRDISKFDPNAAELTDDTKEFIHLTKTATEKLYEECLYKFAVGVKCSEIYEDYQLICTRDKITNEKPRERLIADLAGKNNVYDLVKGQRTYKDYYTGKREYFLQLSEEGFIKQIPTLRSELIEAAKKVEWKYEKDNYLKKYEALIEKLSMKEEIDALLNK